MHLLSLGLERFQTLGRGSYAKDEHRIITLKRSQSHSFQHCMASFYPYDEMKAAAKDPTKESRSAVAKRKTTGEVSWSESDDDHGISADQLQGQEGDDDMSQHRRD